MASSYSLLRKKEISVLPEEICRASTRDSEALIRRLKNTKRLVGHQGCVNTVCWNTSGSRLLSGSDDKQLKIYDAGTKREIVSIVTSHPSNIFSARFVGEDWYGDIRAVSCAGAGSVEYSETTPTGGTLNGSFNCHRSITYQVAVPPTDGNEFLTCEEKGLVRLYDLRVKSECLCDGCSKDVVYSFPTSVSSMAAHPVCPYYLAVGLGDGTIQLLDLRMVQSERASHTIQPLPVQTFSAGCSARKITCVQFNEDGSQLLASYSEDYVYLFNSGLYDSGEDASCVLEPSYFPYFGNCGDGIRSNVEKREDAFASDVCESEAEPELDSSGLPHDVRAMKRIRFRGDWSDTGPEAQPSTRHPLVTHLSRWFDTWLTEAVAENRADPEPQPEERRGVGRWRSWLERRRQARREREQRESAEDAQQPVAGEHRRTSTDEEERLEVTENDTLDVEEQRTADVEEQRTADVEEQRTADVEEQRTADVEEQRTADVEEQRTADVEEQRTSDVEEQRTSDVEKQKTSEVEKQRTADVEKQRTADVEKQRTANVAKQRTLDVEKQRTSDVEKQRTSDVEKQRTADVEKQRTSDVEKQRTADVEKQRTADVETQLPSVVEKGRTSDLENQTIPGMEEHRTSADDDKQLNIGNEKVSDMEKQRSSDVVEGRNLNCVKPDFEKQQDVSHSDSSDSFQLFDDEVAAESEVSAGASSVQVKIERSPFGNKKCRSEGRVHPDDGDMTSDNGIVSEEFMSLDNSVEGGHAADCASMEDDASASGGTFSRNPQHGDGDCDVEVDADRRTCAGGDSHEGRITVTSVNIPEIVLSEDNGTSMKHRKCGRSNQPMSALAAVGPSLLSDSATSSSTSSSATLSSSASALPSTSTASSPSLSSLSSSSSSAAAAIPLHASVKVSTQSMSSSFDETRRSSLPGSEYRPRWSQPCAGGTIKPFMRYRGHRNARTMIKQANFFGDRWVMSGSDCGRVFVWDKWSGDIVNFFLADSHVVNCIQPHPSAHLLATSGVDYDIKVWEPVADAACSLEGLSEVIKRNQVMLEESRNTITMPPMMFVRLLPYLSRRWHMGSRNVAVVETEDAGAGQDSGESTS